LPAFTGVLAFFGNIIPSSLPFALGIGFHAMEDLRAGNPIAENIETEEDD